MLPAPQRNRMRTLPLLFGALIWGSLALGGCSEPAQNKAPVFEDRIGAVAAYVFEANAQDYLATPQPYPLAPELSPEEAMALLGEHLSRTYFNRDQGSDPPIRFDVLGVHRVAAPHRAYRLAVVNMVDPQLEALHVYFQGSAGGQATFYMLTATLLQPQMEPPLADGLVLLYNGEEFPESDHVNFRGIVTPDSVRSVVNKALFRSRQGPPGMTG